jgi:hypothetical protein
MSTVRDRRPIVYGELHPVSNGHTRRGMALDERAKDLPRGRDQDDPRVPSGTSDPDTARSALHAHLSSAIPDDADRLRGHQLVEDLCRS